MDLAIPKSSKGTASDKKAHWHIVRNKLLWHNFFSFFYQVNHRGVYSELHERTRWASNIHIHSLFYTSTITLANRNTTTPNSSGSVLESNGRRESTPLKKARASSLLKRTSRVLAKGLAHTELKLQCGQGCFFFTGPLVFIKCTSFSTNTLKIPPHWIICGLQQTKSEVLPS